MEEVLTPEINENEILIKVKACNICGTDIKILKYKDIESFYQSFFLDKKSENETIKFILPNHIGGFEIVKGLDKEIVLSLLREFQSES